MRPNEPATWELRIGAFRVFYDTEGDELEITAVGVKAHNELYIRGNKVEL